MEVVNVGSVPVDAAIELLLSPESLKQLVGWHGAVCFALVREITAPDFYTSLVENVATIDATTRHHIAFVVFYGERTAISHPVSTSYEPYPHLARYQVQGMSTSKNNEVVTGYEDGSVEFDLDLGGRFRASPSEISGSALSQSMGRATRFLMERYSVSEDAFPCLLFIDSRDPMNSVAARLSATDPLRSLYEEALKPLSQEFSDLSRFWKLRDEIDRKRRFLNDPDSQLRHLAKEIARCDDGLRSHGTDPAAAVARYSNELSQWREVEQVFEGRLDNPAICASLEHLPVAEPVMPRLRGREDRVAQVRMIEEQLRLDSRPNEPQRKRRRRLERLDDLHNSIEKNDAKVTRFIKNSILRLENDLRQIESDQDRRQSLEQDVSLLRKLLREHAFETLDEELASLEQPLRARGYGDDVLTDPSPSAFSVVKLLHDTERLGAKGQPSSAEIRGMTILFLAANPLQTKRLDLEEEMRSLKHALSGVTFRDAITLFAEEAVRPDDLVRHVRTYKPNVIHFSGHGSTDGIVLRNDSGTYQVVEGGSLERFLRGRGIDLVVLNACYSKEQADTICGSVKAVVGTMRAVGDEAARRFTVAFYRSLGEGLSVRDACRDGGDSVALQGLRDVWHSDGNLDLVLVSGPAGDPPPG